MTLPTDTAASLSEKIRESWPAERPIPELAAEPETGRPTGALRQLLDAIRAHQKTPIQTIVEVGGELGGSTRLFLREFPEATVVTIDPWPTGYGHVGKKWPHMQRYAVADGLSYYRVFQSLNWEWRHRLLPLRLTSGEALPLLHRLGLKPDLIYIDGVHTFHGCLDDLVLSHFLFPQATISGDDWEFNPGLAYKQFLGHLFPVQKAVSEFAFTHGNLTVHTVANSYFIGSPAEPVK